LNSQLRWLRAIYEANSVVRVGGLTSYGADPEGTYERAAAMVDLIFQGAKPADLSVKQPTRRFNAAKELGVLVPPALLATTDEVIK
jgi:ABC-type uncharacterized transport system substrate-binding protein